MEKEEFAIALSERDQEEAIREVSLKIKANFPKNINYLIILFTPHYNPANIVKTVNLTLKPQKVLGLQSPALIFEEKVIHKGIVACCINKEAVEWKEKFLESINLQEMESFITSSFKKLKGKGFYLLSFASATISPFTYINKMRSSLGKVINLRGIGYIKKYSAYRPQIVNNNLNEGLVNIALKGLQISYSKLDGYLPLTKPFTITKAATKRGIINEIDGQPAIEIYKRYLEEKFDVFVKNRLFSFYPLGIMTEGIIQMINIIDCLEDGSLVCLGEVKEKALGYIMFFDSNLSLQNLKNKLKIIKKSEPGLAFIVNSLTRKKILRENSEAEIKLTKQILGDKVKMIGLYCDYSFFSDDEKGDIDIESGNFIITLWQ